MKIFTKIFRNIYRILKLFYFIKKKSNFLSKNATHSYFASLPAFYQVIIKNITKTASFFHICHDIFLWFPIVALIHLQFHIICHKPYIIKGSLKWNFMSHPKEAPKIPHESIKLLLLSWWMDVRPSIVWQFSSKQEKERQTHRGKMMM